MPTAPARILVSINDPEQLPDLVHLSCTLAGNDRHTEVYALHVVVIPRALPLDAEMPEEVAFGEGLLAKAEALAEDRCGRRIRTDLLQAREPGPAILEEIHEKGIEMVVLGYRRHRRFGERVLGTTVDYVIKHARCRVVISVRPEPAAEGRAEETA